MNLFNNNNIETFSYLDTWAELYIAINIRDKRCFY